MKEFKNIVGIPPIDFWENAIVAGAEETDRVLSQMPEEPRSETVYKTYVPGDTDMTVVYMCKADNNGTTYLFCDEDLIGLYTSDAYIHKGLTRAERLRNGRHKP